MALTLLAVSVGAAALLTFATPVVTPAQAETGIYLLDRAASAVDFTISASKIFTIKKTGEFTEFTGQLSFDPKDPASTNVDLTVYTSSIDIHNAQNNQLLKSGAFFDVEHFPTMRFMSSSTAVKPDGTFSVTGDMTIRGITRRMTIPVTLRQSQQTASPSGAVFESTFEIDRTMFGLNGHVDTPGFNVSISKKVQIHIAIAARPEASAFPSGSLAR
jgi:polyisoprenoid-binding protein YceI